MKKVGKFLAIALALSMVVAVFAGCGASSSETTAATTTAAETTSSAEKETTEEATTEETTTEEIELESYKIGVISHTNSGGCYDRFMEHLEYVAGEMNVEVSAALGQSADQIITETENFIAAGVNGIIVLNDGGVASRLVNLCSEAGVYIVFSDAGFSFDQEADWADYASNEYFCGCVSHDEAADSAKCVELMAEAGAENFVVFGLPAGISTNFDKRAQGAIDYLQANNITYNEARGYGMAELASNLMSQYPDTDAIFSFVTTSDNFNTTDEAFKDILISSYMVGDVTEEFESGFLNYVSVGTEARIEVAFALLYNGMSGNRLANSDGTAHIVPFSHLWLTSADEWAVFKENAYDGNHVFSIDDIKELIALYNPDVTTDDFDDLGVYFADSDGWLADKEK